MFLWQFIFLLFVAAGIPSEALKATCESYKLPVCTREYDPVCGSDGRLYANECMLCFYNMENHLNTYIVKKGEC